MGWLDACFAELPDPRTGNARRHELLEVLTIALVASICGAESCVDFADFARDREALFREFLRLENGLPSHDTFSRLFRLLDPAAFGTCFGALPRRSWRGWRGRDGDRRQDPAPLVRPRGGGLAAARRDRLRLRCRAWCSVSPRCPRAVTRSPPPAPCSA